MTWHPDMPDEYKNQIVTGDARVLAERIPNESVDLIFTDPVYDRIDDYRWLAETAARVLKPDRACLVWAATPWLPQYLKVMIPPLEWGWMLNWQRYGPCYPGKTGICVLTECLWLQKGKSKTYRKIADWIGCAQNTSNRHSTHKWSKPETVLYTWLDAFTKSDFVVLDTFCGEGTIQAMCSTLHLDYVAFEIDPTTADLARERVANTQPPLFVPEPEQMEMEL